MLTNTPLLLEGQLDSASLTALINREIDAIRVKGFYPTDLCSIIVEKMMATDLYGTYENAPLIGRIGQAFFESQSSAEAKERYWRQSPKWINDMRQACTPYLTPIDKLRLECDEFWPGGASVATLDGQKMFVGLGRVFQAGGHAEPHQDILSWDAPGSPGALTLKAQIAANTYLKLPDFGGGLTLWRVELTSEEYNAIKNPGSYGVDPSSLQKPVATLLPEPGELVLFDSRRLHAVQPSEGGFRVTWSNFIGVEAIDKPLRFWS
jgi:hypothetical protein